MNLINPKPNPNGFYLLQSHAFPAYTVVYELIYLLFMHRTEREAITVIAWP